MKYTSIKSIYNYIRVPKQEIDHGEIEEATAQALRLLKIPEQFEQAFCILTVENHRCNLPKDLRLIEVIAYENIKPVLKQETQTATDLPSSMTVDFNSNIINDTNSQLVLRNMGLGSTPRFNFREHYKIMRPSNDPFTSKYMCTGYPKVYEDCCDYTYKVLTNGQILTSMESGTILLSYLKQPLDEHGDMLIPDDEDLKFTLSRYVMWMFWEARANAKEQNALTLSANFKREWALGSRRTRGNFALANVNWENLVKINERYIRIARAPHVFNYLSRYYAS